jgi:16S rRNA (cytosine1402-N4)-methyltransferase
VERQWVHRPVLVEEVLSLLITDRGGRYADLTVGGAGHAVAILEALSPTGTLIGLDRDPAAVARAATRLAAFGQRAEVAVGRAGGLKPILAVRGIEQVNGVLLDLGLSSDQLLANRGFSFEGDAPLDMRFNPDDASEPAYALLARLGDSELAELFTRHGEFPRRDARRYARRLTAARAAGPLERVAEVREALLPLLPVRRRAQILARLFQSLRIAVNDELGELDRSLEAAATCLAPGGVLCVLSYHSLEDRRVKRFFNPPPPPRRDLPPPAGWPTGRFRPLTRRAIRPSPSEIEVNPRARSARLRAGARREDDSF